MAMTLDELNNLPRLEAESAFSRCCGSQVWSSQMALRRPFASFADLTSAADTVWSGLSPDDWKEAFAHHPKIGDVQNLRTKFASTAAWAAGEQGHVSSASEEIITRLAAGNTLYEDRFGYIFIVCATGKSAEEMLALLESRLNNEPSAELLIAAGEQAKITKIRLEKLLT